MERGLINSGTTTYHLRVGDNYSIRGVSETSPACLGVPLFLERAKLYFPLAKV